MEIFCDESGFTGNNLLDEQQQVFTYASLAIPSEEAAQLLDRIKTRYKLSGHDLKGSLLVKQNRGKLAVTEVLSSLQGRFKYATHLKPYALASKLYEYIFEPTFSKCNSIFYEINFHRFISTLLFTAFRAADISTSQLLDHFMRFAKKGDVTALESLFRVHGTAGHIENPLQAISLYAELHKQVISEEVLAFREPGVPNWILDLSTTSLHGLLALWGEEFETLEVTCDESKPLQGDADFLNMMVGRTEKLRIWFGDEEHPFMFNLGRPILFGKSHEHAGLQLADIIAAAAGAVWNSKYDREQTDATREWTPLVAGGAIGNSIWPDLANADISKAPAFANSMVLLELVDRSLLGKDLCEGMYELHSFGVHSHPHFLKSQRSRR